MADPVGAEMVAEQMRRVLATGAGVQTEVTVVPPEVGPRNLLLAIEPTRDAAGAVTGVIGVSTDITELKKAQEQLSKAVVFREQMMAVLAHDLRNPLSAVCGISAVFARKESLPAEVRQGLEHIERAGKRMNELIGTLLDFSAARFNGSIPLAPGPADLAEIARGVLDELRQAMPDRRIDVEARGATRGRFDGARIAQVISNLASNALSHGAKSQPVRVLIDGRAAQLNLSVSNAGTPISPELIPAIFEPFRRGSPGPDRPRGLGLGLYIAQQIARGHGGALELESSTEAGTVFTLRLPRA